MIDVANGYVDKLIFVKNINLMYLRSVLMLVIVYQISVYWYASCLCYWCVECCFLGKGTGAVHWRHKASEWHWSKPDDVTAYEIPRWDLHLLLPLFTRDSIYAIAHICQANSICLSIRPSVTHVLCVKTAESIIEILSLSARPIILVFCHQGRC